MTVHDRLHLIPQCWYGWQMLPGYGGDGNVPYFSPIRIVRATPRHTGHRILGLAFWNQFYSEGVQDTQMELRILKHESGYLVAEILSEESHPSDRAAVISRLEFDWLRTFCPQLPSVGNCSPQAQRSVSAYLDELFPH